MQGIEEYRRKVENAPVIEKAYNELTRDYENAKRKYDDLSTKRMEAKISQGMEESQRGERFTIIEPAQLPEKPYKPNRIAIVLIGIILALGTGTGVAAVREAMDTSIKTTDELFSLTGAPVLSVIPEMESDEERRARRIKRTLWILAGLGAAALALVIVHLFVMPLESVWFKIQKRMMMGM